MCKPLVSVIIPTYNSENFIKDCINSILSQTYENIEIVVIDDGSYDSTSSIIKDKFYDKVKFIQQSNQKVAIARQNALNVASGDYVAFCDHDDVWFPSKIEKQMNYFLSHPNVSLIHADAVELNLVNQNLSRYSDLHSGIRDDQKLLEVMLLDHSIPLMSTVMIRFDSLKNNQIFFSDMTPGVDDLGVFISLLVCGEKFHFLDEVLVTRKMHSNNQSSNYELRFSRRIELYNNLLSILMPVLTNKDMHLMRKALSDSAYRVACAKYLSDKFIAKDLFFESWKNDKRNLKSLIKHLLCLISLKL
jgi:glycosyltransferase involved in cell wall biosynthesis